ncbi:hypothetical protein ACDY97_35525, partial [Rhizobium mongolense]|uniref:hypothetical protein n=1 Tax=Rhizobium mongolense TaxID=57676 RepID=UPI0035565022
MIRLIPAPGGQIYTAEETDAVIDGNQFLMVAATQRMAQIETQADLRMCGEAVFLEKLQGFAGIDRPHAPDQYPDLQPRIFIGKRQQKFAERFRALMWPQPDIGIEIPADDPDRMSCLSQNLIKRCEIGSAVNQKSRLIRFANSPDVSSVADNAARNDRKSGAAPTRDRRDIINCFCCLTAIGYGSKIGHSLSSALEYYALETPEIRGLFPDGAKAPVVYLNIFPRLKAGDFRGGAKLRR